MNLLAWLPGKKPERKPTLVDERLEAELRQSAEKFSTCPAAVAFINLINLVDSHPRMRLKMLIYHDGQQVRMDLKWCIPGFEPSRFEGEADYRAAIERLTEGWR